MRQIVLDTETTGLDWRNGDRVIEIGCIELLNRNLSGRHFHCYINPERDVPAEAEAVHGISTEALAGKPTFAGIVEGFSDFIRDSELIIHNAGFDLGFLDYELTLLGRAPIDELCSGYIDTLKLAKEQHPGKKASLNALCERYEIANAHRTLHGALLDAELLAEVYLAMTRGQDSLLIAFDESPPSEKVAAERQRVRAPLLVLRASETELSQHEQILADIELTNKRPSLWQTLENNEH